MFGLFRIAARNLRRNLRRTLITGLAIAGGLSLLIWTDTLSQGTYDALIRKGVSTMAGHVVVQAEGYEAEPDMHKLVSDAAAVQDKLQAALPDATIVSRAQVQGLLQSTRNTAGVAAVGVDPVGEPKVSDWHEKVLVEGTKPGAWLEEGDDKGILLGEELAVTLEVKVGDKVVLMAQGEDEVVNRLFRVRGLFRTGAAEIDGSMALITLGAAQAVLKRPDSATQVSVHLDDPRKVPEALASVRAALPSDGVEILPWQEALPEMYQFTVMDRQSARAMFFVMGVIVAMGVLNTVLMSVMERMREFGVMLALGTRPSQVFRVILLEGVLLGLFATAIGAAGGIILTIPTIIYGIDYGAMMGENVEIAGISMDAQVYAAWNWPGTIGFCIAAWVMTVGSSLWPAWKAARLEPVQAMRHV
jgi:ABC-type lipoprotein release transport system permease subunit